MPSLILIPGLLCDQRLWRSQIAALEHNSKITVADITHGSTIQEMATAVLQNAPRSFSLAGFSLGSQVALEIVKRAGDRVERLALLSATHAGLLPAAEAAIRRAIERIKQGQFERYLDQVYLDYFARHEAGEKDLKQIFVSMAQAVGEQAGLRQMRALLAIATPFSYLDRIDCPTVIIGGRDDHRTTPEAHRQLAKEIPGADLAIIDGAAHFTPIEQPRKVGNILRGWITSNCKNTKFEKSLMGIMQ